MKQTEITAPCRLLDSNGLITEAGWARKPYWTYDRKDVKASWMRIKEWDYYYILSDSSKRGITFTISDLGYAGLMAVCWMDFENNTSEQIDTISPLTRGNITEKAGSIRYSGKKLELAFTADNEKRVITFKVPQWDMEGELELKQPSDRDSMNIATSWAENRRQFYYNRKINCMPVSGTVRKGSEVCHFSPEKDFAGLDWGRGYWPWKNRWFWSSCSTLLDGEPFGFNLGYGFSDRSPASENMLFFKNRAHKLEEVSFIYDENNYTGPWQITSSDRRIELQFTPLFDRASSVNLLLIRSVQHQVFGKFSGTAILDDGTILTLDNLTGFAEDVLNYW